MATQLQVRPSELVGLTGYEAYCLDETLVILKSEIDSRVQGVSKNEKNAEKAALARSRWLTKYIGGPEASVETKGQFRDPASMF